MRVRDLACCLAVVAACTQIPSPGPPSLEMMERKGWGGYVVVNTRPSGRVAGELIAIDSKYIYVLRRPIRPTALTVTELAQVSTATLYRYEPEGGFGTWGLVGALSSISHGVLLVLSVPVWIVSAGVSSDFERSHVIMNYPESGWREFQNWARFPQGLPPNVTEQSLIRLQTSAAPAQPAPSTPP